MNEQSKLRRKKIKKRVTKKLTSIYFKYLFREEENEKSMLQLFTKKIL